MKILHYSLGFPPYSVGGLTKYCLDLAREQVRQGHDVSMLWPGRVTNSDVTKIKEHKDFEMIRSYELIGQNYVPQIYGIADTSLFEIQTNVDEVIEFLDKKRFDVVHFHTLMGLNEAIIDEIKRQKIKMVYTTHDFFGICPKTTLFFDGQTCANNFECEGCQDCNSNALSQKKMKLIQSPMYRSVKTNSLVERVRKSQKSKKFEEDQKNTGVKDTSLSAKEKYKSLREYYLGILDKIDVIHYNSQYMKDVFEKYLDHEGKVLNIVHSGIQKNTDRIKEATDGRMINITYVGAIADYKGYYMLIDVLDSLFAEGYSNFRLNVYGDAPENKPFIKVHEPYVSSELSDIMQDADFLVNLHDVSYGFTVLEAISNGTPVVVTNEVGAKDLVKNNMTGIICDYDFDSIRDGIKSLLTNNTKLNVMRKNIRAMVRIPTLAEHTEQLIKEFY